MAQKILAIVGTYRKGRVIDTAATRRFMERLLGYAYWPWEAKAGPKPRIKQPDKKAVTITSTACPAFIAKIAMPGARKALKIAAQAVGAKARTSLFYGMVAPTPDATLTEKDRQKARQAGQRLAQSLDEQPTPASTTETRALSDPMEGYDLAGTEPTDSFRGRGEVVFVGRNSV